MKTLYFHTNQYVRRQGNVIDFTEYRNRLQRSAVAANAAPAAVGDPVSYHWEVDEFLPLPPLVAAHHEKGHQPRRQRRGRSRLELSLADVLELCITAATLGLVITVWVMFLV